MIATLLLAAACSAASAPALGPMPQDSLAVRLTPTHYELSLRLDFAEESLEGTAAPFSQSVIRFQLQVDHALP
jgi:hypothetical protein